MRPPPQHSDQRHARRARLPPTQRLGVVDPRAGRARGAFEGEERVACEKGLGLRIRLECGQGCAPCFIA